MADDEQDHRASSPRITAEGALWDAVHSHGRRISDLERGAVALWGHAGQPGAIAMLSDHVTAQGKRLAELEQARWKLAGAVMLAGSLTGVILFALSHLLGK